MNVGILIAGIIVTGIVLLAMGVLIWGLRLEARDRQEESRARGTMQRRRSDEE